VGNGTIQDIVLPFKPQFLILKPNGSNGAVWHEKMEPLGSFANSANGTNYSSCGLARVIDYGAGGGLVTVLTPGTNSNHLNDNGVTVRYLAIRDPKKRMMCVGGDDFDSQQTSAAGKG